MEDNEDQGKIDSKYIIINKKGHGNTSVVYVVKEVTNQMIYAAKVLKNPSNLFQNELDILNSLKELKNPYIVNVITSGVGIIDRKNYKKQRQYIILENAPNGELINYIYYPKVGFGERRSKLIFSKILEGVQAFHNAGICHRDLKMENILLDVNFIPKIIDFGFATLNQDNLTDIRGTESYCAPEILRGKTYNGFKADIFSLGVVLFTLTTAKFGFGTARRNDPYYKYIAKNEIDSYWKEVEDLIPAISKELKELFIRMVSYSPNKRPTIQEILDSDWMKEIKNLNKDQLEQLENEIREEFLKRKPIVEDAIKKEAKVKPEQTVDSFGNRGGNDEEDHFNTNLTLKYAQTGLNMNHYIKLKGDLVPYKFMNKLIKKFKKELQTECDISVESENKAKFEVTFIEEINEEDEEENPEEEEEINEKIKENIIGRKTVIQVKLFNSLNGGYLLRLVKKEGEQKKYLETLEKIYSLFKN
jgi:serine/threonine protein kinase